MKYKGLLIFVMLSLCVACSKKQETTWHESDVVVKPYAPQLHFKSQVEPIDMVSVPSAVDGVISQLYIMPGETVQKNQPLARIESFALESRYRQVLSDFLEAKNQLRQSQEYFTGTKTLYESDIVDKQSYLNDMARLDSAKIKFENARHALSELQKLLPKQLRVSALAMDNEKDMKKWLAQPTRYLALTAPQSGIVFLAKTYLSNVNSPPELVGKSVKKDEAVLNVANFSGLKLQFLIDEKTVNLIKPGQVVGITLPALAQGAFEGHIVHVNVQAVASHSALAQYWASAEVAHVPKHLREKIKMGMHAHVTLSLPAKKRLFVPIDAVSIDQGQAFLWKINPDTHKRQKMRVKTGSTTLSEVSIEQGVQAGDRIAWKWKSDD